MKQKLLIACGLLHRPGALLLDEPLTGLDPVGIRRMKATIVARAEAGAAVILSSHLLHLVEEVCTRLLIMNRGRALALGTIAEIRAARPDMAGRTLEELFVGIDRGRWLARLDDRGPVSTSPGARPGTASSARSGGSALPAT